MRHDGGFPQFLLQTICARAALGITLSSVTCFPAQAATFRSSFSAAMQQFATETSPESRLELGAEVSSDSLLYERNLPASEAHFYSFVETGESGDRSFDLDDAALRLRVGRTGHFWFGRVHPLSEGFGKTERAWVGRTSSIGANWVQNRSNTLAPRVSGWIGSGIHFKPSENGMFLTAAFSPLFLPDSGPRLELSESNPPKGSRYASLPPLSMDLTQDGSEFPMHYRVNVGKITDIVLRNQYFVAIGHENESHRLSAMAWSAPRPQADTQVSGKVKIGPRKIYVLVDAVPDFPRETYLGAQWATRLAPLSPALDAAYELRSGRLTLSASIEPWRFFRAGYLDTVETVKNEADLAPETSSESGAPGPAPRFAERLVWAEIPAAAFPFRLQPSLRVEQHLKTLGRWMRPGLQFIVDDRFTAYASANIITGMDKSYFGEWRSLDSVSIGAHFQW